MNIIFIGYTREDENTYEIYTFVINTKAKKKTKKR
jgi:hypothetical protein